MERTLEQIQSTVCQVFDITETELRGQSKKGVLADARIIFIGLAQECNVNLVSAVSHIGRTYVARQHMLIQYESIRKIYTKKINKCRELLGLPQSAPIHINRKDIIKKGIISLKKSFSQSPNQPICRYTTKEIQRMVNACAAALEWGLR